MNNKQIAELISYSADLCKNIEEMQQFKVVENVKKIVVASLEMECLDTLAKMIANKDMLNSWLKDMSQNHISFEVINRHHVRFASNSSDWRAYTQDETLYVEQTKRTTKIVPCDELGFRCKT